LDVGIADRGELIMTEKKSIGAQLVAKRYEKMTPEQRTEAARNAAKKRWAKATKKKEST
jgi:hypothetical protein